MKAPVPLRLFLATANPGKAAEFRALSQALAEAGLAAEGLRVEVAGAGEAGGMPPVSEDAGTFEGNALKKAGALKARLPGDAWALADDSGICVDALGGAPGVESAYFAGPESDAARNLAKLADAMAGVPAGRRGAQYVCVLALLGPGGVRELFRGACQGTLGTSPRGTGGFGYDPLFIPEGFTQTMAELPAAAKNRVSHRGRAWMHCVRWLAARG
jgi:XTP/dITP diphosphohydrolase